MKLTNLDSELLKTKGITEQQLSEQISNFKSGFPFLSIERAARVGDGIFSFVDNQPQEYAAKWNAMISGSKLKVVKFVPASGAATRMFKDFYAFLDSGQRNSAVEQTLENIEKFAFYGELKELGVDFGDARSVVSTILEDGLSYGRKPKALIKFHKYDEQGRTACEEHLVEGAQYGASSGGKVNLHFTISKEHRDGFEQVVGAAQEALSKRFGVVYNISYSVQKPSTDTIAVDMDNEPFRTAEGGLLFRPSGHGALIENLNDIDGDIIFIKTIDNICSEERRIDTIRYKKALGALALEVQARLFSYLTDLDMGDIDMEEAWDYLAKTFGCSLPKGRKTQEALRALLNRPLRVCGMVRNEGEPGGGPFWVKGSGGELSLQIAESAQISAEQKALMQEATHFNPVDLVCLPKDYKGTKFDLKEYIDPSTGFISQKSFEGRELKAMELPGLWNGAMARWNTIFVEVPITTFSPVKVLGDLLREAHQ